MELAYHGARFHGWQVQPNAVSVQSTLEKALSTVLRRDVSVTGAGRTDTGVHARKMYAHFDSPEIQEEAIPRLITSLNRLCGRDIAIYAIHPVSSDFHARFDAVRRTYKYFITKRENPFRKEFAWHVPAPLDVEKMNEGASILLQTSDFTSFSKLHTDVKTNICRVDEALWEEDDEGYVFTISADRFLRNMVRAVVGTLVEIGRGKMNLEGFQDVINRKDRCAAGQSVPAHGLFLWEVEYPSLIPQKK